MANRSIIVTGPQGCGKTRNAKKIARKFGLEAWAELEGAERIHRNGVLYLSNDPAPKNTNGCPVITYEQAMEGVK